jgi:signal transduction histidine kinase
MTSVLSSLTNRIFLGTALLVIVAISVAVYRVNVSVTARAEADLQHGLGEAATLVDEFSRKQFDDFARDARLVANLPVLRAAVATSDAPTVQPIAAEYQEEIKADLFVVLDRSDQVLASAGILTGPDLVRGAIAGRGNTRSATWVWPYASGVMLVTSVPMEYLGSLIVGSSLDRAAVDRIKAVTNSDIALIAGSRLVVSTLPAEYSAALEASARLSGTFDLRLGQEEYIARTQSLRLSGDASSDLTAIVLRSRTEQTSFLQPLHREIAITGLIAVFVATLFSYAIARTVTRPLRAVTATMREMAATGNLSSAGPAVTRWDDEDAQLLAATFRQLTTSLDKFQREAAQRERLSSLGRLSTVIAHEVRNPLMIIKTALRGLRQNPTPDVVAETATSINEEVARLNTVVTGVLDFARPIRFEMGPVNLAEICRSAVAAGSAGPSDVPVSVDIAPDAAAAEIVSDAERLRGVLVNVLTNAQHAVAKRPRDGTPLISLRLRRAGTGWRIDIADRGPGVEPEDLARVFEPFFTTRSAGSGLGLAIGRNVIEVLGGTITMHSEPGAGATVTVTLPAASTPPAQPAL